MAVITRPFKRKSCIPQGKTGIRENLRRQQDKTIVYSTENKDFNINITAASFTILFLVSAFLRFSTWLEDGQMGSAKSWLEAPLLLLQVAFFVNICALGLSSMRLKPSKSSKPSGVSDLSIFEGKECRLQVDIAHQEPQRSFQHT